MMIISMKTGHPKKMAKILRQLWKSKDNVKKLYFPPPHTTPVHT
jgi:hypothetical protein